MKDVDTGHGLARRSHSQWPGLKPRSFPAQSLSIFRSFLGFGDTEHLPRAGATRRSQRSPHHRVSEQKGVRGRRRGPREGRGRGRVCGGSEDTGAPGTLTGIPKAGCRALGSAKETRGPVAQSQTSWDGRTEGQLRGGAKAPRLPGGLFGDPPPLQPLEGCDTSGNQHPALRPDSRLGRPPRTHT